MNQTDYLIGKAIEQERARIVAALGAEIGTVINIQRALRIVNNQPAPTFSTQEQQR